MQDSLYNDIAEIAQRLENTPGNPNVLDIPIAKDNGSRKNTGFVQRLNSAVNAVSVENKDELPEDWWDIKKLNNRHRQVARLAYAGLTGREIAPICGYSEATVARLLQHPLLQHRIENMHKMGDAEVVKAKGLIRDHAMELVMSGMDLALKSDSENIRAKMTCEMLDRAGISPIKQLDVRTTTVNANRLMEMKARQERRRNVVATPVNSSREQSDASSE